jgi:pimeloyl-ACP methyl ester carboxylesterase
LSGPSSGSFISQRLHLRYTDWGNPGAPTLILLHDVLDHSRSWDWVAEDLQRDFNVVAPDLRGHGDSDHAPAGIYSTAAYLFDLVQFVRRFRHRRVAIVGHGLGGGLALAYAGVYPTKVSRVVSIEGLGDPPRVAAARAAIPMDQRVANWISERQGLAGRSPKRYGAIEDAFARVKWRNPRLSPELALHLTEHGCVRNEDDTYSWKFDNYVRAPGGPFDVQDEFHKLWAKVTCPTQLIFGAETKMADSFGHVAHEVVPTAKVEVVSGAGHWVHHDALGAFLATVRGFL